MVQWNDAAEIAKESQIFTKLIFALFGLYLWEIFQTSDFEWSIITGKRKFGWPLIFFFLCRYCMGFAFVGLIISFEVHHSINCQALYTFNSWTGNMAILCASTSLMIRTMALWNRSIKVVVPLCILGLGHWAILWRGMFIVDAQFNAEAGQCVITQTNHVFLNVTFFTTMAVDFLVLCTTIAALMRKSVHSGLWKLLFQDGLIYFCITFFCNAVPAILNVINLNILMNVMATIPAATVSSIAACRLVMRLQNYSVGSDVYVHQVSETTTPPAHVTFGTAMSRRYTPRAPEVCVTTEEIVVEDYPTRPSSTLSANKVTLHDLESGNGSCEKINAT